MRNLIPGPRFTAAGLTAVALLSGCALSATSRAQQTAVVARFGDKSPQAPWAAASWFAPGAWGCPSGVIMAGAASTDDPDSRPQPQRGLLVRVLTATDIRINGGDGIVAIVDCAALSSGGDVVVQASRHLYGYQQSADRTILPLTEPVPLPGEMGATDQCSLASTHDNNATITYTCVQPFGKSTTGRITVDARTLNVRPGDGS